MVARLTRDHVCLVCEERGFDLLSYENSRSNFASEWAQPEGWPYRDVRVCYASTMQMAIDEKLVVVASTVEEYCDCVVELHKQNYNSDSCSFWVCWDE